MNPLREAHSIAKAGANSRTPENSPYTNWELCAARPASEGEPYTSPPPSVFSYT
jgi:hypothetical protein